MTERVVDGLEIIEIDDAQRLRSRLVAGHAGKGHVEGGAVWQYRECVDARDPFPGGDTLVTTQRDLAQLHALGDERSLVVEWNPGRGSLLPQSTHSHSVRARERRQN